MKVTIQQVKNIIKNKDFTRQEKSKFLYNLFKEEENFFTFCRTILPHAFRKPSPEFHKEVIKEFMGPGDSALAAPRGHAKQISDSTPILTSKGWTTHGKLKVGDYVFSPSGKQIKVLAKNKKTASDYIVYFRNGEIIRCHGLHEWLVFDKNKKSYRVVETKDMLGDWSKKYIRSRFQLPFRNPIEMSYKQLPIDPYFLGLWLGDGSNSKPCIIHSKEDIEPILSVPYKISTQCIHKTTGVITTYFSHQNIIQNIRKLNLYKNKHIPNIYLMGSIQQRLDLLAGLIDSDGHVDKKRGRIRFINNNYKLIKDVEQLVISLCSNPYITEQEGYSKFFPNGNNYITKKTYTLNFDPIIDIPVRIYRKKIKRFPIRQRIGIIKVEYKPNGEIGNCIQVDSQDGLYLVGKKLIPTHNSTLIGLGYLLWLIAYEKEKYIIYGSQNHAKSIQFLEPLTTEIKTNPMYRFIYGDFEITKSHDEITGKDREDIFDIKGMRVQALSFEKNPRGLKYYSYRPTLILLDDIEDDERVINPILRKKDADRLNKMIIPSLDTDVGRMKMVGTILHHDSQLVHKIRNLNGKIYKAIYSDGTILWPEMFSKQKLESIKHKIGPAAFQSEYLNEPVDDTFSIIKREWMLECRDDTLSYSDTGKYRDKYQGVDFGFSDRVTGDESAFVGIGRSSDGYTVIDCLSKKGMTITEQFDYIEYLSGINGYTDNALEENSIRSMSNELKKYKFPFTLFWTSSKDAAYKKQLDPEFDNKRHTIGKMGMITRLGTQFENHRIRLPFKTDLDKQITNKLIDECATYARQDGKLVEIGVHGNIPIALGYAIERAEMEMFEFDFGVLDTGLVDDDDDSDADYDDYNLED